MKASCIILSITIFLAIMAVCIMVKFATDITVEERRREYGLLGGDVYQYARAMGVIALQENVSLPLAERFPYVAAVMRNTSTLWSFACFASVVLIKWVVTSAHCRWPGTTHRVLLFHDFSRNYTHTYPILFWRLHEKYNVSNPTPIYDIAVAKLKVDIYPFTIRPSMVENKKSKDVVSAVWKTVSTMNHKLYLTNELDKIDVEIVSFNRCFESYAVKAHESLICIDLSVHEDCFVHEFGPLYSRDKVVGILTVKPRDCDMKIAIFTNVSFYTNWILKSTHTTYYG